MPIRGGTPTESKETNTAPKGARAKLEQLTVLVGNYLNLNGQIKNLTTEKDKDNKAIKKIVTDSPELFEVNGNHREITLPAGDGVTEFFVQLQKAESVSTVDNVISLFRKKLGKKAENFIVSTESLTPNALESAYNQGLLTEKDILDFTVTKTTERLIVKLKDDK